MREGGFADGERRLMLMTKDGELYFLKIIKVKGAYRSAVWVWDTYPGEPQKGLPAFISEYSGLHVTIKDVKKYFVERGFEFKRPSSKPPMWINRLELNEKLDRFIDDSAKMENVIRKEN